MRCANMKQKEGLIELITSAEKGAQATASSFLPLYVRHKGRIWPRGVSQK